jgi:tetratricopeptide (TPR) repeat protein
MEVRPLMRAESVAALVSVAQSLSTADAHLLAEALGDLPLALTQAGRLLNVTRLPVPQYLAELGKHMSKVLGEGAASEQSLMATTQIAAAKLSAVDPAAEQLVTLCAYLAAEPVPATLFAGAPAGLLSGPLASIIADPIALHRAMAHASSFGLAFLSDLGIQLHRLTQGLLRDRLDQEERRRLARIAATLVANLAPSDADSPQTWPSWSVVLPHLLAVRSVAATVADLRPTYSAMVRYLLVRGETTTALAVADELYQDWSSQAGADDPDVLTMAVRLAHAYQASGQYERAAELNGDTLDRRRRILGLDDPDTLAVANNLVASLLSVHRYEQARLLADETVERSRRTLGVDHQFTLVAQENLASALDASGRHDSAYAIAEAIFRSREHALGNDDPATLRAANNLADSLYVLGERVRASSLYQDTLTRRRRVLGADHPDTLISASNLAVCWHALGKLQLARDLYADTLARQRRILGDDHPDATASSTNLTSVMNAIGTEEIDSGQQLSEPGQPQARPAEPSTVEGFPRPLDEGWVDEPSGRSPRGPASDPLYRGIIAMDVVGSGRRDDQLLLKMRDDLREIIRTTLSMQGIDLDSIEVQDLGDGLRLVLPSVVSPKVLLIPLIVNLDTNLRLHRKAASELARIRLRVAVHHGLVHDDGGVAAGGALRHVARLLDAASVRQVIAALPEANLVLVMSDEFYASLVADGGTLDPTACQSTDISEKETKCHAWLHVPGQRPPLPTIASTPPDHGVDEWHSSPH